MKIDLKKIRQDIIDGLYGAEFSEDDHVFIVRCVDQALENADKGISLVLKTPNQEPVEVDVDILRLQPGDRVVIVLEGGLKIDGVLRV